MYIEANSWQGSACSVSSTRRVEWRLWFACVFWHGRDNWDENFLSQLEEEDIATEEADDVDEEPDEPPWTVY